MKKFFSSFYLILIFAFLYIPILTMVFFSFNSTNSTSVFAGFSLQWYGKLFRDQGIMDALFNSLIIAFLSAIFATILGTAAAIGIHNLPKKTRGIVMNVSNIPIMNPEIVTAVALMLIFVFVARVFGFELGFTTVLLAHISFNVPYVILNVLPKLRQMNKHLYEAAMDLGAPPRVAFYKVVLPEILPGVVSGFLMALTFSLDDYIITRFTSGNFQTLPIKIFSELKKTLPLKYNALSMILFLIIITILILMNLKNSREYKLENKRN